VTFLNWRIQEVKALDISRFAVNLGVAAALLASCTGPQSGSTNPTLSTETTQTNVRQASQSSTALIYVTTTKGIVMVSLPKGKIVGSIPWQPGAFNTYLCSDPHNGNVFVSESMTVYQYAHGATSPTASFSFPSGYNEAHGCAVDPTTGNLAVTISGASEKSAVLVYADAQGTPTVYTDKQLRYFGYPAYDDAGNLFVGSDTDHGGFRIAELPSGESQFTLIRITNADEGPVKIQWDGNYLVFSGTTPSGGGAIDQIEITGRTAQLVNTVPLTSGWGMFFWIQGGSVLGPLKKTLKNNNHSVAAWQYPAGGNPIAKYFGLTKGEKDNFGLDLTVSVSPTR
jgi:hypothetical protein